MNVIWRLFLGSAVITLIISISTTSAAPITPIKSIPDDEFHQILPEPDLSPKDDVVAYVRPTNDPTPVKPKIRVPASPIIVAPVKTPKPTTTNVSGFHLDRNVSWYGPGFYGHRTACGYAYTKTIMGVAHKTLPCGTLVTFKNPKNGRIATVPVIDRGPYVAGRQWDLSGGLCVYLDHCYTGSIYYKIGK